MKKKGISLIALVITIIVLAVLAVGVIHILIRNGIIDKAIFAVKENNKEEMYFALEEEVLDLRAEKIGLEVSQEFANELRNRLQNKYPQLNANVKYNSKNKSISVEYEKDMIPYNVVIDDKYNVVFEEKKLVYAEKPELWNVSENKGEYCINQYIGTGEDLNNIIIPNMVGDKKITYIRISNQNLTGTLTISDGIEKIGIASFMINKGLIGDLVIPNSVIDIENNAFMFCPGLTSLTIGDGVETIGKDVFRMCTGLTGDLIIPDSVISIGDSTFASCSGFKSLKIGNSVESIGLAAFKWCSGLETASIPNSVTTIGNYIFDDCTKLKLVTVGSKEVESLVRKSGYTGKIVIDETINKPIK